MPSQTRKNPPSNDMTRTTYQKDRTTVIEPIMEGYDSNPNTGKAGPTKYSRKRSDYNSQVTPGKWTTGSMKDCK